MSQVAPRLAVLVALALPSSVFADQGEAHEEKPTVEQALDLLSPVSIGDPVSGSWKLAGVSTHREYIRFELETPAGGSTCKATYELTACSGQDNGLVPLGRYHLFFIESTCTADTGELTRAVGDLIQANEARGPSLVPPSGSGLEPGQGPGRRPADALMNPYSVLCLALLAAGLVLLVPVLANREIRARLIHLSPGGPQALDVALPVLAVLVAFAVRILDAPMTIANVNHHACNWIRIAMDGIAQGIGPYGNGYFALFHLLFRAGLPESARTIMTANVVMGALSVLPVYLLASVLFKDRWASLFAAFAWALLPAHVRLSGSEDFVALLSLSQVLAALAAVLAGRFSSLPALAAGICLALFSVQVRPEGWIMAPVSAFFVVASAGTDGVRVLARRPWTWVLLATGLIVALPFAHHVAYRILHETGAHMDIKPFSRHTIEALFTFRSTREGIGNLTLNPLFGTPLVPLLAAVAAVMRRKEHGAVLAALVLSYLVFAMSVVGVQHGVIPTIRLQASWQWTAVVLAGGGFGWLAARLERRRGLVPALFALALCVSYLPYRPFIHRLYVEQMEYAFLEEAFASVPDGCTIVHLDHQVGLVDNYLPTWIPAEHGRRVGFEEISSYLESTGRGDDDCVLYYRGLTCFTFAPEDPPMPEQPLCRKMDALPHAIVGSRSIPARADGRHVIFVDPIPLELRRIGSP